MLQKNKLWQGCVLSNENAYKLGLVSSLETDKRAIVISHDCDLPNDKENFVEIIMATVISAPNPMYAYARHPRCLHLKLSTHAGKQVCLELWQADKDKIGKQSLINLQNGEQTLLLSEEEKRALKQWLAARYGRPAFPDTFEARLRKQVGKESVIKEVETILKPASYYLVGLFFDLGEERFIELKDSEPYFLSISVVYNSAEGGQTAREIAEKTASDIKALFYKAYGPADSTNEIALEKCTAVADSFITLADLRKVDQWRLEHISLRENPVGTFLAVGEQSV